MCANLQAKLITFRPKFAQKWIWGPNFKKLSLNLESGPPSSLACQFSVKIDNFEFFGLSFGKIPDMCDIRFENELGGDGAGCTI